MTPAEIRTLRLTIGLTTAEVAFLTRARADSVEAWERGTIRPSAVQGRILDAIASIVLPRKLMAGVSPRRIETAERPAR